MKQKAITWYDSKAFFVDLVYSIIPQINYLRFEFSDSTLDIFVVDSIAKISVCKGILFFILDRATYYNRLNIYT